MVPLWLGVLLDYLVNQLPNFGFQPDFAALAADQGWHILKFIKFIAPGLPMGDRFALQRSSASGTCGWVQHITAPSFESRIVPFGGIISMDG
jgi:hypothetical protein